MTLSTTLFEIDLLLISIYHFLGFDLFNVVCILLKMDDICFVNITMRKLQSVENVEILRLWCSFLTSSAYERINTGNIQFIIYTQKKLQNY